MDGICDRFSATTPTDGQLQPDRERTNACNPCRRYSLSLSARRNSCNVCDQSQPAVNIPSVPPTPSGMGRARSQTMGFEPNPATLRVPATPRQHGIHASYTHLISSFGFDVSRVVASSQLSWPKTQWAGLQPKSTLTTRAP